MSTSNQDMGKMYIVVTLSFLILFFVNIVFAAINLYFWATHGLQALLQGMNFTQRIEYSLYLKWILLVDGLWIMSAAMFILKRKHYKTDPNLHYLAYNPIQDPRICVVIPAYNEELAIESVVKDYMYQKNVKHVIVIDNHSTDNTASIAERCGAKVIKKEYNKGYAHSCAIGFRESLKTDTNIIALAEADATFSGYDIAKMVPFLDNCDMVVGTRQIQVMVEAGNQNSMFYVWGNLFLAKLIQIKYFSLLHMGIVQLTDVGCSYRCIRRKALEKIIDKFTIPETDEVVHSAEGGLFALFMTMLGIENDLKIVEVPITFKRRVGISKSGSYKKTKGIRYGLRFLWYIISS